MGDALAARWTLPSSIIIIACTSKTVYCCKTNVSCTVKQMLETKRKKKKHSLETTLEFGSHKKHVHLRYECIPTSEINGMLPLLLRYKPIANSHRPYLKLIKYLQKLLPHLQPKGAVDCVWMVVVILCKCIMIMVMPINCFCTLIFFLTLKSTLLNQ